MSKFKVGDRVFCTGANEDSEPIRPTKNHWCTITELPRIRHQSYAQYEAKFPHSLMHCSEAELRRFDPRKLVLL